MYFHLGIVLLFLIEKVCKKNYIKLDVIINDTISFANFANQSLNFLIS